MKDIAQAVGVSQASVSYAFNHPTRLSTEVREAILSKAAELGYAGPSSTRRSDNAAVGALGLMVMDSLSYAFEDASNVLLMKGLAEVGELARVALTLLPLDPGADPAAPAAVPRWIDLVDGLIIHSLPENNATLDAVIGRLPVVIIDSPKRPGVPFVGIKDRQAAKEAMRHLVDLGHERIVVLVDRLSPDGESGNASVARVNAAVDRVARERVHGYWDALADSPLSRQDVAVVEAGGFDRGTAVIAAHNLLEEHHPTAVICTSDALAFGVLEAMAERGLSAPGDVSVVGFDDAPGAAAQGLTTVRQPLMDKGRTAARLLMERMRGGNRVQVILESELMVRSSTAAPRAD